jgi:hypothetical protein
MKTRKSITYLFRGLALGALMIAATGIYFGTTAGRAGDDSSLRGNQVGIAYPSSENSQGLWVSAYWVQRDEREEMAYDELLKDFIGIPSPATKITHLESRIASLLADAARDPSRNTPQLNREIERLDYQIDMLRLNAMQNQSAEQRAAERHQENLDILEATRRSNKYY